MSEIYDRLQDPGMCGMLILPIDVFPFSYRALEAISTAYGYKSPLDAITKMLMDTLRYKTTNDILFSQS